MYICTCTVDLLSTVLESAVSLDSTRVQWSLTGEAIVDAVTGIGKVRMDLVFIIYNTHLLFQFNSITPTITCIGAYAPVN